MTKSFSLSPSVEIGKKNSGLYGLVPLPGRSAGVPSSLAQTRAMAKSPVWRGYDQLSISPPYSPIARDGA